MFIFINNALVFNFGSNIGLYWLVLYSEIFNIGIGNLRPGPEIWNLKCSFNFLFEMVSWFFLVVFYHSLFNLRFCVYTLILSGTFHEFNRNVHCALTKCRNRGEGAIGLIQTKISQIKKQKHKIQRIHGGSQCLFQRKIATRWLSRWSRQLPQHHLLFFQRNIYFFSFLRTSPSQSENY